jgi:hypothetical protein
VRWVWVRFGRGGEGDGVVGAWVDGLLVDPWMGRSVDISCSSGPCCWEVDWSGVKEIVVDGGASDIAPGPAGVFGGVGAAAASSIGGLIPPDMSLVSMDGYETGGKTRVRHATGHRT